MITVVTALFDGNSFGIPHTTDVYNASWVDKLYRGLKRNTSVPFELVCLVDKDYPFEEPIVPVGFLSGNNTVGGWSILLEMYRPDLSRDWRITIGLDTIITGNVDCYLEPDKDFAMVNDPMHKNEVCNALTWCSPNSAQIIWDVWTREKQWVIEHCRLPLQEYKGGRVTWTPSEMILLRKLFNTKNPVPIIDNIHKGIYSYKCHILKYPNLLQSARIVYFHGVPKPHEISDQELLKHWI